MTSRTGPCSTFRRGSAPARGGGSTLNEGRRIVDLTARSGNHTDPDWVCTSTFAPERP
jgi:hypothetical protein